MTLKTFILYHGNTERVVADTLDAQRLLDQYKSIGDKHYLGDGHYFYHDNVQAEVWAKMKVTRNKKYLGDRPAVLQCVVEIDDDLVMDLDNREEQEYFFTEMKRLKHELDKNQLGIVQYCDAYLCNHLSERLSLGMLTKTFVYKDKFKAFDALFSNQSRISYGITHHFRTEKQYVLRGNYRILDLKRVDLDLEEVKPR